MNGKILNKKAQAMEVGQVVTTLMLIVIIFIVLFVFMVYMRFNVSGSAEKAYREVDMSDTAWNILNALLVTEDDSRGVPYSKLIEESALDSSTKTITRAKLKTWLDENVPEDTGSGMFSLGIDYRFLAIYDKTELFHIHGWREPSGKKKTYEASVELPTQDMKKIEVILEVG